MPRSSRRRSPTARVRSSSTVPTLYDREALYGVGSSDYPDNPRRFALLVRAALEFAARRGSAPSIVHAHDWQGGPRAGLPAHALRARTRRSAACRRVFTIHNLAYQGRARRLAAGARSRVGCSTRRRSLEYWAQVSLLKGGINFSETDHDGEPALRRGDPDAASSRFGFDGILAARRVDLVGILNGIDTEAWNPAPIRFLPAPYDAPTCRAKQDAKRALLRRYGLPSDDAALAGPARRHGVADGGAEGPRPDRSVGDELPHLGARFVVLGTGEPRFEDDVADAGGAVSRSHRRPHRLRRAPVAPDRGRQRHVPDAVAVRAVRPEPDVQPALRHRADRARGRRAGRHGAGLQSGAHSPPASCSTSTPPGRCSRRSRRALTLFADTRQWRALQVAGMQQDFSWDRSAQEYVKIYERAMDEEARAGRFGPGARQGPVARDQGRGDNDGG